MMMMMGVVELVVKLCLKGCLLILLFHSSRTLYFIVVSFDLVECEVGGFRVEKVCLMKHIMSVLHAMRRYDGIIFWNGKSSFLIAWTI
jgi:hypothetical protein